MIADPLPTAGLPRTGVIIPALNEAANLRVLLPRLRALQVGQVVVGDNGSSDDTRVVTESAGATWAFAPRRGYGAACYAGLERLAPHIDIVAFMDADLSDDEAYLPALIRPIVEGEYDLVLGARLAELRHTGAMSLPQRVANTLFPILVEAGWGHRFADMGPFRAIRRSALEAIDMQDRAFGWTFEMQIRAVELNLRIRELPVPYYPRRYGRSHISGTVRGVLTAAYWITRTCAGLWLTRGRRVQRASRSAVRKAGCAVGRSTPAGCAASTARPSKRVASSRARERRSK